jgi:hypothetical protein
LIEDFKKTLRAWQEPYTCRGQGHRLGCPVQEDVTDMFLKPSDLGADRGLSSIKLLGGLRETSDLSHCHECFEFLDI